MKNGSLSLHDADVKAGSAEKWLVAFVILYGNNRSFKALGVCYFIIICQSNAFSC